MFKIVRCLEKTNLTRRLLGFRNQDNGIEGDRMTLDNQTPDIYNNGVNGDTPISKHASFMSFVESFMMTLTYSELEGKILAEWPSVNDSNHDARHRSIHHFDTCSFPEDRKDR